MKIAIFHELHSGGARRAVNEFAKRLKKKDVVDLYFIDERKDEVEIDNFSKVYFFKHKTKPLSNSFLKRIYKDTIELVRLYKLHHKVAKLIDSKEYDFVFVHPSKYTQAPFILRFLKTSKIYYSQEALRIIYDPLHSKIENIILPKKIYESIARLLRKKIDLDNIAKAQLILANSQFTKSNLKKAYKKDSKVAYLGVDIKFFKPGIKKDIDILYIGDTDALSGYELLIKAQKQIKQKIKVEYLITGATWISDELLSRLYSQAKITLALYRNEPFGLIPLEAMASGSTVIALNEGGYKETIINGKNGFLIDFNSKALGDLIIKLLQNNTKLQEISKNARLDVEKNWDWDSKTRELRLVFERFLNERT
jgi:glycosyltransferase involved in cell wall biosynthesis